MHRKSTFSHSTRCITLFNIPPFPSNIHACLDIQTITALMMAARAPFTHTSSTLDLTASETVSPNRPFLHNTTTRINNPITSNPDYFHSNLHAVTNTNQPTYMPTPLRSGIDVAPSTPTPFYRSAQATGISRSPSPHPFAIPTIRSIRSPTIETIRFVSLCILWYATSAISSNTGKVILNNFRFPVTLTIIQFFFVAGCCFIFSRPVLGWSTQLRSPTRSILRGTLPMAAFQVGGHIFSSLAISRVPVSTVHTIKVGLPLDYPR